MKKKFLFASVALSALFAACSNEDVLNEQAVVGQEDRPMTNVALSFEEKNVAVGGVESRLDFGSVPGQGYQWIFEDGDRIGALLMDEWNREDCGIENFTMTDYVHTNYAFIRETGADGKAQWVTPLNAPVCEGNYFFYFPYNPTMVHRGHVAWSVNPVQKNYDDNGQHWPMQAVKDNQKWIGYKFVGHEAQGAVNKIGFDFVPLFAMPTFDIINKAGDLKVNKLVVRVTSNRSNNQIDLNGTHDLMATTMVLAPESRGFDNVNKIWEEKDYNWHTSKMWTHAQAYTDFGYDESYKHPIINKLVCDLDDKATDDMRWEVNGQPVFPITAGDASYNMAPTYEYTAEFKNYKVKQFGHVQAMLVMPAGIYAYGQNETFEALLYVTSEAGDEYVVRIDLGKPQTQGGTNNSAHDDINSAAANKFLKAGQITKFTADFDASAMQSYNITDFKVTSSSDLEWVVNEAIDSKPGTDTGIYDLNITTSGKRVVLTPAIEEKLASRPNVRLHINGEITIGEGTTENAINLLWFNNPNMKTKLNIINKQVKKVADVVDPTTALSTPYAYLNNVSDLYIGENGDLNTEAVKVEVEENIENDGIFNATDVDAGTFENNGETNAVNIDVFDSSKTAFTNNGTLNAETVDANLYNYGTATITDRVSTIRNEGVATVYNVDTATGLMNGAWSNKAAGEITFMGGTVSSGQNFGEAAVEGNTLFDGFNNFGTMDINAEAKIYQYAQNAVNATINITEEGALKVREKAYMYNFMGATINVEGNLAQNIQNSGEIFVKNNGQVIVNGIVPQDEQLSDDEVEGVSVGGYNGIIDVTEANGQMNDAQKAMDYKQGNEGNHFRYVVKESTDAVALKAALYARISSNNINDNFISVLFDADDTISYYGIMDKNIQILHVVVADGTTLKIEYVAGTTGVTEFQNLSNTCGTQVDYEAFEVEPTAKVILADKATLKLNDNSEAWVDGIFNANDHSKLEGKVIVKGTGEFWVSTKSANNTWTLDITEWTGEDWGWK